MPVSNQTVSVLGLFPQFGNGHIGGIQASAEVAWEAVKRNSNADLLVYSRNTNSNGSTHQHNSRAKAILAAIRNNKTTDVVLVWQIDLIKLTPFLRNSGKKIILYLHGIEAWRNQDWFTKYITRNVDLFLTNSDYTWNRFLTYNPSLAKAQHLTVALGIEEAISDPIPTPDTQPTALMLARLSRGENYKGHREVIEAWPEVLKQLPNAKLLIAGTGDLQNELGMAVNRLGLTSNIQLLGEVDEETKQKLLRQSRCMLMPSRNEGFGLVYLEAMRLGRPCLVSTLDAGREVVNPPEAGLAVNPDDRDQLVKGISTLLDHNSQWQSLSERARTRYEQNYTAMHFQNRLIKAIFS